MRGGLARRYFPGIVRIAATGASPPPMANGLRAAGLQMLHVKRRAVP
jgi:hypothetical protein